MDKPTLTELISGQIDISVRKNSGDIEDIVANIKPKESVTVNAKVKVSKFGKDFSFETDLGCTISEAHKFKKMAFVYDPDAPFHPDMLTQQMSDDDEEDFGDAN